MLLIDLDRSHPLAASAGRFVRDCLSALLGWPRGWWSAHRAQRRLRAYGPAAVLALRPVARVRQN